MTNDIFELNLLKEGKASNESYHLELKEWIDLQMIINVNFTNPTAISDVKFDQFVIKIKSTKLFVSAESGQPL